MNELEKYIRAHAAEFDAAEVPQGHEERFLAAVEDLDCARNDGVAARSGAAGEGMAFGAAGWGAWAVLAGAVAVLLAAVVLLRPAEGRGFFFGVGNDPQKVYLAYLDRVEDARLALADNEDYNWEGILRGMTEEAVPLIEQLPEELSGRQQARILKQYYGEILAGVEKLKKGK